MNNNELVTALIENAITMDFINEATGTSDTIKKTTELDHRINMLFPNKSIASKEYTEYLKGKLDPEKAKVLHDAINHDLKEIIKEAKTLDNETPEDHKKLLKLSVHRNLVTGPKGIAAFAGALISGFGFGAAPTTLVNGVLRRSIGTLGMGLLELGISIGGLVLIKKYEKNELKDENIAMGYILQGAYYAISRNNRAYAVCLKKSKTPENKKAAKNLMTTDKAELRENIRNLPRIAKVVNKEKNNDK